MLNFFFLIPKVGLKQYNQKFSQPKLIHNWRSSFISRYVFIICIIFVVFLSCCHVVSYINSTNKTILLPSNHKTKDFSQQPWNWSQQHFSKLLYVNIRQVLISSLQICQSAMCSNLFGVFVINNILKAIVYLDC